MARGLKVKGEENAMALLKRKGKSPELMPPDLQNAEARMKESDLVNANAGRKKGPSPLVLGGGALGLTALALGGWYLLGPKTPPEDDSPPQVVRRPPGSGPMAGRQNGSPAKGAGAKGASPVKTVAPSGLVAGSNRTRIATGVTKTTSTRTRTSVGPGGTTSRTTTSTSIKATGQKTVANARLAPRPGLSTQDVRRMAATLPGRLGQRPATLPAGAPEFPASSPNQVPRMVPVKGAPTPMGPPDGMAGRPGRDGWRNEVMVAAPIVSRVRTGMSTGSAAPAALKLLWQQGAAAKQRGDTSAARRVWTKILDLSPGHPGIQEAIDKLGRR